MMKASMKMAMQSFSSHRMISNYEEMFYLPAADQYSQLLQNHARKAEALYEQRHRLSQLWSNISIEQPLRTIEGPYRVGDTFQVTSVVHLGELQPDEVDVELFYGNLKTVEAVSGIRTRLMNVEENLDNGSYRYACDIACSDAGRFGFTARITAHGDDHIKYTPAFITWARLS